MPSDSFTMFRLHYRFGTGAARLSDGMLNGYAGRKLET